MTLYLAIQIQGLEHKPVTSSRTGKVKFLWILQLKRIAQFKSNYCKQSGCRHFRKLRQIERLDEYQETFREMKTFRI